MTRLLGPSVSAGTVLTLQWWKALVVLLDSIAPERSAFVCNLINESYAKRFISNLTHCRVNETRGVGRWEKVKCLRCRKSLEDTHGLFMALTMLIQGHGYMNVRPVEPKTGLSFPEAVRQARRLHLHYRCVHDSFRLLDRARTIFCDVGINKGLVFITTVDKRVTVVALKLSKSLSFLNVFLVTPVCSFESPPERNRNSKPSTWPWQFG